MKTLLRVISAATLGFGFVVACSPVQFGMDTSKCEEVGETCVVDESGNYKFDYSVTAGGGKVDILIVNDNSASMSFEQRALADRFNNFVQRLDQRKVDYRIAITTSDISNQVSGGTEGNNPRAINQNGALQDGRLITFGNGAKYLTPTTSNRVNLFRGAIERPETKQCETFIANWVKANGIRSTELGSALQTQYDQQYKVNCPSGDERGIYAANLVLNNNPDSFMRPDAYFVVIFLADENVRSNFFYAPVSEDRAGTFAQNFLNKYGTSKTMKAHAVVVKSDGCLTTQNSQTLLDSSGAPVSATTGFVSGSKGNEFLGLTNAGWGVSVDICSLNYTTALGDINTSIEDQIKDVRLLCANPQDLQVSINGTPAAATGYSVSVVGNLLTINPKLAVGDQINLSYSCTSL